MSKKVSKLSTVKELNVDAVNQSLWLVKIPAFVAEQWTQNRNGELVGELKVPKKKPPSEKNVVSKQFKVTLESIGDKKVPVDFILEEVGKTSAPSDSFVAFSSSELTKGFVLDGKVTKNLLLKPEGTKEYRQLIRERGLTKLLSRRETHVANVVDVQRSQNQSHTVEFITSDKNELKRKSLDSSRSAAAGGGKLLKSTEMDTNALRSRVFESFAMKEKQVFKEIFEFCQGVEGLTKESDLRDILAQYTKYTSRGAYKHLYELKPEYRDHSALVNDSVA